MTAIPKENTYYTPKEYLQQERKATHKSEYYKGEIFTMAGASLIHDEIVGNIILLSKMLCVSRKNLAVFSSLICDCTFLLIRFTLTPM
jgi:Uma2 family endonuclease